MLSYRIRTVSLKFLKLRELDWKIQLGFAGWVDGAPIAYKDDGFIVDWTPMVITSHYGQNQDIGITAADVAADEDNWWTDQDFSQIQYITMELATHVV